MWFNGSDRFSDRFSRLWRFFFSHLDYHFYSLLALGTMIKWRRSINSLKFVGSKEVEQVIRMAETCLSTSLYIWNTAGRIMRRWIMISCLDSTCKRISWPLGSGLIHFRRLFLVYELIRAAGIFISMIPSLAF